MTTEGTYPALSELQAHFSARNWRKALPAALSEGWLRGLARDLHSVDTGRSGCGEPDRPLFFVACIAAGRAREQHIDVVLTDDEDAKFLLTGYQFLVYRELVHRSLEFETVDDESAFLEFVDQLLKARVRDPRQAH